MKKRLIRTSLPIVCFLSASLTASHVLADWTSDEPYRGYNKGYGDFPPEDIDQQLSASTDEKVPVETTPQADNTAAASNINQPATNPAQNYPGQPVQQPAYGNYYQNRYYSPPGMQRYNRGSSFSGPRNNRGSSFSTPWDNSRSGFSGPWNNRGSSFSTPWDNSRSGFSGPWNNRGSGFSGPWNNNNGSGFSGPWNNNNRSGFSPWGNGGGWSW